ncbi:MAG: hypothetical protein U0269_10820 [Polyangiales bacterium]
MNARARKLPRLCALCTALALVSVLAAPDVEAQRRRRRTNTRRNTAPTEEPANNSGNESGNNPSTEASSSSAATAATAATDPSTSASAEPSAPPAEAPPPPPPGPSPAAIDASLGARWYGRFFAYNQDVFGELRNYDLAAAPALSATVEWYPGAHFSRGPASWFGVIAQGAYVLGVSSRDSRDTVYGTTAFWFDVGLRVRIPLGLHDLGLHATYGQQHFTIASNGGGAPSANDPGVPGVQYQSVRVGASVRIGASERVGILLGASGLPLISAGDIAQNYFVRATAAGVEAQLGLAIGLISGLELRVLADARRYFYAMNPRVGDAWVAGGALDHHVTAGAAIAFRR